MPIKRLVKEESSFPRLGVLRKGSPKSGEGRSTRMGKDLDYFRFDTDDMGAMDAFTDAFGNEPREIDVFLPYESTSENFSFWQESWVAGGLKHRCDGETCVRWLTKDGTYSEEPIPCPGDCKEVGRLMVIIPQLQRMAYVTVLTHSINDILELDSNLRAVEAWNGTLQGVPLILHRKEKLVSTPGKDGKRVSRQKWMLSVEAKPEWVTLQIAKMSNNALEITDSPALRITGKVVDDENPSDYKEALLIDPPEVIHPDEIRGAGRFDDRDPMPPPHKPDPVESLDDVPEVAVEPPVDSASPFEDPSVGATANTTINTKSSTFKRFMAGGTGYYGKGWDEKRKALVSAVSKGRTKSSKELTIDEVKRLIVGIEELADAETPS